VEAAWIVIQLGRSEWTRWVLAQGRPSESVNIDIHLENHLNALEKKSAASSTHVLLRRKQSKCQMFEFYGGVGTAYMKQGGVPGICSDLGEFGFNVMVCRTVDSAANRNTRWWIEKESVFLAKMSKQFAAAFQIISFCFESFLI
jgi:hypothetical protein